MTAPWPGGISSTDEHLAAGSQSLAYSLATLAFSTRNSFHAMPQTGLRDGS